MIILGCMLAGAALGAITARRRGGKGFDVAQYASVWGIIGAIIGMALTLGVERLL